MFSASACGLLPRALDASKRIIVAAQSLTCVRLSGPANESKIAVRRSLFERIGVLKLVVGFHLGQSQLSVLLSNTSLSNRDDFPAVIVVSLFPTVSCYSPA